MYEFTIDNYGSEVPENIEDVMNDMNQILIERVEPLITEEMDQFEEKEIWREIANELFLEWAKDEWGASGCSLWYAVMLDTEDSDWGTGSYIRSEADKILAKYRKDYPEAYIAVIDNAPFNPVCVDEIR